MQTNPDQLQQGDVLLTIVPSMPRGGRTVPMSDRWQGYLVAEGEATGHAHVLEGAGVLEVREVDGVLYARIGEPGARLRHDEHHYTELSPSTVVRCSATDRPEHARVQEYDHFAEEARQVED